MEKVLRSTGKIAIAVNGQVMRDYGGWYWPVSDIGAWADERELRRLGHVKLADDLKAAIAEAKSQKELVNG